ncbi:hypothetical protein BKA80DRAFT_123899 [Phyllosticta citrichinensis]
MRKWPARCQCLSRTNGRRARLDGARAKPQRNLRCISPPPSVLSTRQTQSSPSNRVPTCRSIWPTRRFPSATPARPRCHSSNATKPSCCSGDAANAPRSTPRASALTTDVGEPSDAAPAGRSLIPKVTYSSCVRHRPSRRSALCSLESSNPFFLHSVALTNPSRIDLGAWFRGTAGTLRLSCRTDKFHGKDFLQYSTVLRGRPRPR